MTDQVQPNNENPYATADSFREHLASIQADAIKSENTSIENNKTEKPSDDTPTERAAIPEKEAVESNREGSEDDKDVEYVLEESRSTNNEREPRLIPKSRLKQETEKRRVAEEQLMKEREERIRFETELNTWKQLQTRQNQEPQQRAPEPELEHLDALDQDAHQVYSRKIKELEYKLERVANHTSQQTNALQLENIVKSQRENFQKENPEFEKALSFLADKELEIAKNWYRTEDEAKQAVSNKFAGMVQGAINNGKNAPEMFYNMAKTYGYASAPSSKEPEDYNEPNVDIDAINRNKAKSASIGKIPNKANLGGNSGNILDFNQCLRDPKNPASGIDPVKFAQYRQRLAKSAS